MNGLKAQWVVRAGLLPDEPMGDYTKAWQYTSDDWAEDGDTRGDIYHHMARQAHEWAGKLQTGSLNWVHVEYMWM